MEPQAESDNADTLLCGYIKAKFTLVDGVTLGMQKFDRFARQFKSMRVTDHFVYIALGHQDLPDNQTAIQYIKSIETLGGKITRLDFTLDILSPFDFSSYYDIMCTSQARYTPTLITSPRGDTVYIGRRSSSRMLRIYDKRSEIKVRKKVDIGFDLTRVELEIKRDLVPVYKALFLSGDCSAIINDIGKRYALPRFLMDAKTIKPQQIAPRIDGPMAFVMRYKRIIRDAYIQSQAQFYEILGV